MSKAIAFPVSAYDYYVNSIDNNDNYNLMSLLALSYFGIKIYIKEKKTNTDSIPDVYIGLQDVLLAHDFIRFFYDYDRPVYDNKNENILWIFPKLNIKKFLSEYLFNINNDANYFYYDQSTLNKLIMIMYGFVKYEYDNIDNNIRDQIEKLNYPTLILANIYLYEKGILKVSDEKNGIGIMLDLNSEKRKDLVFTNNEYKLKESIVSTLNKIENSNYSMNDFM